MRIRAARTLIFERQAGDLLAFNFLANSCFVCSVSLLAFLAGLETWTDAQCAAALVSDSTAEEARALIAGLVDSAAIVMEDSPLAVKEAAFETNWRWGTPAALFHFSVQDRQYMSIEESDARQSIRLSEEPQPSLSLDNGRASETIQLPPAIAGNDLLELMARRRTVRTAASRKMGLSEISQCLFAGLGITGETRGAAGSLPLAMTPSGGARNPYEAYIYARDVDGIEAGFYHYSAVDHSLARTNSEERPRPSEILGGQSWANAMPSIVILCARFERTMWKYDDANAYRVVLIEAGHIGQNIMLAATRNGMTACPTAALNHALISRCVADENRVTHSPIYALTLSYPAPTA